MCASPGPADKLCANRPSLDAITAYEGAAHRYEEAVQQTHALAEERDKIRAEWDGFKKSRLDEFMKGFQAISMKLKEMYQVERADAGSQGVGLHFRDGR